MSLECLHAVSILHAYAPPRCLCSILVAGIVMLAVGVLTPLFQYIPMAALAAIIISAVSDMVDFKILLSLWKVKRKVPCSLT